MKFIIILLTLLFVNSCLSKHDDKEMEHLTLVWKIDNIKWNATSLIYKENYLYGLTRNKIIKINFEDGKVIWENDNSTSYDNQQPLIIYDHIFVGGFDKITCFNLDGDIGWFNKIGDKIGQTLCHQDSLIFGSVRGQGIYAFDQNDGRIVWQTKPEYRQMSSSKPVIQSSLLIASDMDFSDKSNKYTAAIDPRNGGIIWKTAHTGYFGSKAVLDSQNIFVCYDSIYKKGMIRSLSVNDGKVNWETPLRPQAHYKPLVVGDKIFVPSYEKGITCLNKNTGEVLWNTSGKDYSPSTELINYKDGIFYGTFSRKFIGVDQDGNIFLEENFDYGIGNPLIINGELYVNDGGGSMYKLRL
ncbi:PQQ-binding-like beta-propeller repeat protein [Limibacter armeniacum]|uniref:PQQ-binding-like beta-propeller repeat protein n=1 Tax=Limibacter armeniacum TaxID=466084 RepID=UPI002FE57E61